MIGYTVQLVILPSRKANSVCDSQQCGIAVLCGYEIGALGLTMNFIPMGGNKPDKYVSKFERGIKMKEIETNL